MVNSAVFIVASRRSEGAKPRPAEDYASGRRAGGTAGNVTPGRFAGRRGSFSMARRVAALILFALLAAACNSGLPGTGKASVPSVSPTVSAASPSPTATATPDATATPWPTQGPEASPVVEESPLPTGYQRVTSVESGYTIGFPATWVFVKSDGAETVADQVAALKASAPKLAAFVDAETGLLGVAVKLVAFDKVSDTTGMNANLVITAPMPSTDMKTLASTYATQIKSTYKVSAVVCPGFRG